MKTKAMLALQGFILIVGVVCGNFSGARDLGQQSSKFVAVFRDRLNGLSWARALPGEYRNGCVDAEDSFDESKCTYIEFVEGDGLYHKVKAEDSAAEMACKEIGARLPSWPEYLSLMKNFETMLKPNFNRPSDLAPIYSHLELTEKGRTAMQAVFGDMNTDRDYFWSSTVNSDSSRYATVFGSRGTIGHWGERHLPGAVRCVLK